MPDRYPAEPVRSTALRTKLSILSQNNPNFDTRRPRTPVLCLSMLTAFVTDGRMDGHNTGV